MTGTRGGAAYGETWVIWLPVGVLLGPDGQIDRDTGGNKMRTILIAQREAGFTARLAAALSAVGYRTIICPGPLPPSLRCIRCDVGYCPLTEAADLFIYDPGLVGTTVGGATHRLAVGSSRAHPDIPLFLVWPEDHEPDGLAEVMAENPNARLASTDPDRLVQQVWHLVGPPSASVWRRAA